MIYPRSMIKHILTGCLLVMIAACDNTDKPASSEGSNEHIQSDQSSAQEVYYFGFDLRGSPQEDARQYLPFLKYLETATGYTFKLRFTPKHESTIDNLGNNKIQFAAMGAVSYITAAEKYNVIPLVRGLNNNNKAEYRSYIVVAKNSRINELEDLRNKRFAFGDTNSTQGHLIPRIILSQNNLVFADFASYFYTGSHQKCAEAVLSDKADACGMQDTLGEELIGEKKLRLLHASDFFPSSGMVANGSLDKQVIENVRQAMLKFEPNGKQAKDLYHWESTEMPNGFIQAQTEDYNELKQWLINFKMIAVGQAQ